MLLGRADRPEEVRREVSIEEKVCSLLNVNTSL